MMAGAEITPPITQAVRFKASLLFINEFEI
jgi:hypothetical protein